MAISASNVGAALKRMYENPAKIIDATLGQSAFLANIKRTPVFPAGTYAGGQGFVKCPIKFANNAGTAALFANAKANYTALQMKAFVLDAASAYAWTCIENDLLMSIGGNKAEAKAFLTDKDELVRSQVLEPLGFALSRDIYGDGTGCLGQVDATYASGATVPIEHPYNNINKFFVGMKLCAASTKLGATRAAGTNTMTITNIDVTAVPPTITVGAEITGLAAGDYLFPDGDKDTAGTTDYYRLYGLDAWIPSSVTSTSFCNVDRTVDARALAGHRFDCSSGYTVEESILIGCSLVAQTGGKADLVILSPRAHRELMFELGSKGSYSLQEFKASQAFNIQFQGVTLNTSGGVVKVLSDPFCPDNVAWILTSSTWELYTVGVSPAIADLDGSILHRIEATYDWEVRAHFKGQLGCHRPGDNCRITLKSLS